MSKKQSKNEGNIQENQEIKLGQLYRADNISLRIIYCDFDRIIFIDTQSKEIKRSKTEDFSYFISAEGLNLIPEYQIPCGAASKHMKKAAEKRKVFEELLLAYFPDWDLIFQGRSKKPYVDRAIAQLGIDRSTFRKNIYRYLLSGRNISSLLDKRCNNKSQIRVKEEYSEPLQYALENFKHVKNVAEARRNMKAKYYLRKIEVNGEYRMVVDSNCPSYAQVRNYIKGGLGGKSITDYKKDQAEYTNKCKPHPGNAQYGVYAPGQLFEIDEVELDCYLVSENNPSIVIGKAVVYVCIDAKTSTVMAVKVGLKNNSYSGFCDVILTLLEPHSKQAEEYGARCDDNVFPSLVIPAALRCDHGSEYECNALEAACNEIGIKVDFVMVRGGSRKGLVENFHKQLQGGMKDVLKNAGFIVKTPGTETLPGVYAKAKETACLTLSDLSKIAYEAAAYINQKPLESYDPVAGMLYELTVPSPINIWNYEVKNTIDPVNVTEENRGWYMFALLNRSNGKRQRCFSIGREGITYKNGKLKYCIDKPWFWEMLSKSGKKLEIRYMDSRIDCIWVREGNVIHVIPLSKKREQLSTLKGMSWDEFDVICRLNSKKQEQEIENDNFTRWVEYKKGAEETVEIAKSVQGGKKNDTKDIRAARADEKKMYEAKPETDRNRIARNTIQLPEDGDERELIIDTQEEPITFNTFYDEEHIQADTSEDRRKQLALFMED